MILLLYVMCESKIHDLDPVCPHHIGVIPRAHPSICQASAQKEHSFVWFDCLCDPLISTPNSLQIFHGFGARSKPREATLAVLFRPTSRNRSSTDSPTIVCAFQINSAQATLRVCSPETLEPLYDAHYSDMIRKSWRGAFSSCKAEVVSTL